MKTTLTFGISAVMLLFAAPSPAQQLHVLHVHQHAGSGTAESAPANGMAGRGMMSGTMGEHCAMMMQMHQKMESDTKAQDVKLKELTTAMDQATGDQKVTAMAAVINELITQRTARQEMRDHMQSQMMGHMMEHMQHGGKTAMMQCPMMAPQGKSKAMVGHDMTKMKAN